MTARKSKAVQQPVQKKQQSLKEVLASQKSNKPFMPKTFEEFWAFAEANIRSSCTSEATGIFNMEKFARIKRGIKPIAKDLWYANAKDREIFYRSLAAQEN